MVKSFDSFFVRVYFVKVCNEYTQSNKLLLFSSWESLVCDLGRFVCSCNYLTKHSRPLGVGCVLFHLRFSEKVSNKLDILSGLRGGKSDRTQYGEESGKHKIEVEDYARQRF